MKKSITADKIGFASVSVVIPCYRCADTIERAVESVATQSLPPKEILLVDDCSRDDGKTLTVLHRVQKEFQGKVEIKVLSLKKNNGPAVARNAGWDAATQPYIAFLDADDEWCSEKLSIQYEYMRENPDIAVTGHLYINLPGNKPALPPSSRLSHKNVSPLSLLFRNCFPASSVMLKSGINFRFPVGKRYAEDFYLWQQVAFAKFPIVRIEVPLVNYYKAQYGESGLSAQLWQMERGELSNFVSLYRSGSINWLLFVAATSFSISKYAKRLLVTSINRLLRCKL